MIFDAHVHIQPWEMMRREARAMLDRGRDPLEMRRIMSEPEALLRHLDAEGIPRVVSINYVSPEVMGFTEAVNEYALAYASQCESRVIPIGSIHPHTTPKPQQRIDHLIARGIRGFKVHPSHQCVYPNEYRGAASALEWVYRRAEQEGLVVYFHTGTSIFPGARNAYADPIHIDDVAVDFPDLKIVLAHGGRPIWMRTCLFLVRRHPNVLMDISGIPPKRLLEYFPRIAEIADKVLFGSDWPAPGVPGMRANADAVSALDLPADAREKILHANAKRLFAG